MHTGFKCRNISLEKLFSLLTANSPPESTRTFFQENKAISGVSIISEQTFGRFPDHQNTQNQLLLLFHDVSILLYPLQGETISEYKYLL
jgi:hypothetical protein